MQLGNVDFPGEGRERMEADGSRELVEFTGLGVQVAFHRRDTRLGPFAMVGIPNDVGHDVVRQDVAEDVLAEGGEQEGVCGRSKGAEGAVGRSKDGEAGLGQFSAVPRSQAGHDALDALVDEIHATVQGRAGNQRLRGCRSDGKGDGLVLPPGQHAGIQVDFLERSSQSRERPREQEHLRERRERGEEWDLLDNVDHPVLGQNRPVFKQF